jgi:TRAP-type C4-dicarboxylate transport system substrate-binding protein
MCNERIIRTRLGIFAAVAFTLVACGDNNPASGGDDKAGGSADPVVLTMANLDDSFRFSPAVQYFVDRVEELSGGSLRVETHFEWGNFADDAEQQVVRAVAAGDADLAEVGTPVLDVLGVSSLRALSAPMLIDSYPLQKAVIASEIPGDMLAGLDAAGVAGIAVLADGLRKPIAVERPLLSPADFDGITFQAYRSTTYADAIHALGASQSEAIGPHRAAGLRAGEIDGFEASLFGYSNLGLAWLAPYVTTNVNLWAQPHVLIANPDALDGLSDDQRGWLMQAGADAAERSTDLVDGDADLVADLCATGARFADASDADLEAFEQAFAPVFITLEKDPQTKRFIEQIGELKQATDPGPALSLPAGCTGSADTGDTGATGTVPPSDASVDAATAALNGTYRWTLTKDDARAHGAPSDKTPEGMAFFPVILTVSLDDGIWTWPDECDTDDCTFVVDGDRIVFYWHKVGAVLEFTFTTDADGTLHLYPLAPMDPGDVFVWSTKPWEKID